MQLNWLQDVEKQVLPLLQGLLAQGSIYSSQVGPDQQPVQKHW
jgi:hypothetical protein